MLALRIVRAYTGKDRVLKFEGAYHGFADGVLFSTNYGHPDRWPEHPRPDPDTPGIPSSHARDISHSAVERHRHHPRDRRGQPR